MAWVFPTLAGFFLLLIFFHFLKVRFSIAWQSLNQIEGSVGLSCLGLAREFAFTRGTVTAPVSPPLPPPPPTVDVQESPSDFKHSGLGQAGFLTFPAFLQLKMVALRHHFKAASLKFALDLRVWRSLLAFLIRSGFRVLKLLHLKLDYLHIGFEDVLILGRFAAVWSTFAGMVPSLACPVSYGFNERPARAKVGIAGGFTALNFIFFGMALVFSFPWLTLAGRFKASWRNPALNRWQRRLLLF